MQVSIRRSWDPSYKMLWLLLFKHLLLSCIYLIWIHSSSNSDAILDNSGGLDPNGIGALYGLAQLVLYAAFFKSTKQQQVAAAELKETSLSEVVVDPTKNADSKQTKALNLMFVSEH
ncbi:hypothetical protein MLD38_027676 [Melastoma candidum]|uniref:Uncharacterized protein n=1 Tax=Melastoma candidum TaxID=119954 RepID=A0ACB9P2D1_9MYRT|nr:hypothetical protein MLD38_027676 [Melastoma candidum]